MHLPDMLGFEIDRMMAGAKKTRLVVVDRSRTSSRLWQLFRFGFAVTNLNILSGFWLNSLR
jgi:hypothetical protein